MGKDHQHKSIMATVFWIWVITMTLAYGWQFNGYLRPLLKLFGLR